jgi:hypothetical protein
MQAKTSERVLKRDEEYMLCVWQYLLQLAKTHGLHTTCEKRLTYTLAGSYNCAGWTTRVDPPRQCHHSSRTTWALND